MAIDKLRYVKKVVSSPKFLNLRILFELKRWKRLLRDFNFTQKDIANEQKNVLIATNIGGNLNVFAFDLVLGLALRSRGHSVTFSMCHGSVPACMNCELNKFSNVNEFLTDGSRKLCKSCIKTGETALKVGSFQSIKLVKGQQDSIKEWDDEVASSGALRFLAIGQKEKSKHFEEVYKLFLTASRRMNFEFADVLDGRHFDMIIAHHGIYVPQGNVTHLARERNIPLITWVQGYRKNTFIFGHGDTYHKSLLNENSDFTNLSDSDMVKTLEYMESRDTGINDWIRFGIRTMDQTKPLPLSRTKRKVLLLTNVSWDAQLHYESRIFTNMHEWIEKTIQWFENQDNLELVIRIHPAELTGKIVTNDPVKNFLADKFPHLSENIKIVGPDEEISTYALMELADLGLIFATKAGLELAVKGVPLVIAGESWLRGHGFSNDPVSQKQYFELLEKFKSGVQKLQVDKEAALNFAHYFFFEKSITVNSVSSINRYPYLRPKITNNWSNSDPGLMRIIQGIESGKYEF